MLAGIKVILWDIDGTLLDFKAAETAGIRMGFAHFNLGTCTDEMLERYASINTGYWEALERGELTREQVLTGRFYDFFRQEGIPTDCVEAFNDLYQKNLGETIVFRDNAYELVQSLKGKVLQCAASNGTKVAQDRKLEKSGLGVLLDYVFISEQIGAEKPTTGFFDAIFETLPDYRREEYLIVGDSLTSDIRGGNNAGIRTCWYNPSKKKKNQDVRVDMEIRSLQEIRDILKL